MGPGHLFICSSHNLEVNRKASPDRFPKSNKSLFRGSGNTPYVFSEDRTKEKTPGTKELTLQA
jgi:hypothetical protein